METDRKNARIVVLVIAIIILLWMLNDSRSIRQHLTDQSEISKQNEMASHLTEKPTTADANDPNKTKAISETQKSP